MAKRTTLVDLAREADLDLDEVLVSLWDIGIDSVEDPDDVLSVADAKRARSALGIGSPKEETTVDFWVRRTGMSRDDLAALLGELGVALKPTMRKLPKGALSKLRRRFRTVVEVPVEEPPMLPPCPEFVWENVGVVRQEICLLTEEDLHRIHEALVRDFAADDDPISPPGVRSEHLLSSALSRPQTGLGPERKYPTVEMAGAALLHSLVLNHPFHNGNKRSGLVALLVFLDDNGLLPTCHESDLFRFVLRVAQHGVAPMHCPDLADREVLAIASWIKAHSRRIEKGERPLPWHRLRRILRSFGCDSEVSSRVGNRINLTRDVTRRGLFGRTKVQRLSFQAAYGDEGRTVERNTLNRIRHALELDEDHGVDSKAFYEADAVPDDFIQQYRTLLRRLARL